MNKKNLFQLFFLLTGLLGLCPFKLNAKSYLINQLPTTQKIVALTFDADMTHKMKRDLLSGKVKTLYDKKIVDILINEKVPATIFTTGLWLETYNQEYLDLSKNKLLEFGNHSYSHIGFKNDCYHLGTLPDKADAKELSLTENLLNKSKFHVAKLFRFPGLCYEDSDLSIVSKLGYNIIGSNLTNTDAFIKNPKTVANSVLKQVVPGSIIILHLNGAPDAPATSAALPTIIHELRKKGYSFVKVSDMLNK